jgi:hypothetical protein
VDKFVYGLVERGAPVASQGEYEQHSFCCEMAGAKAMVEHFVLRLPNSRNGGGDKVEAVNH